MNKCVPYMFILKEWIPACAGMTKESRFPLSVIPVKTGIQNFTGAAYYSTSQLTPLIGLTR